MCPLLAHEVPFFLFIVLHTVYRKLKTKLIFAIKGKFFKEKAFWPEDSYEQPEKEPFLTLQNQPRKLQY